MAITTCLISNLDNTIYLNHSTDKFEIEAILYYLNLYERASDYRNEQIV